MACSFFTPRNGFRQPESCGMLGQSLDHCMTFLYFACTDCKIFTSAGDRWAYWTLEQTRVVNHIETVDVDAVLQTAEYWNPPEESWRRYLKDVFPAVRDFLSTHRTHRIVFGTSEEFAPDNDDYFFDWMEVGEVDRPRVRYLVEVLHLETWEQVTEYIEKLKQEPTWWDDRHETPSLREKAKLKFAQLVSAK